MAWEDVPKDMGVYQQTLDAQLAAGTDRRVAEGRARSKAIRAYHDANPDEAELPADDRGHGVREFSCLDAGKPCSANGSIPFHKGIEVCDRRPACSPGATEGHL
jgi:hypothetical protein